jgi:hypothetical protein
MEATDQNPEITVYMDRSKALDIVDHTAPLCTPSTNKESMAHYGASSAMHAQRSLQG